MIKRAATALIMIAIGLPAIFIGGVFYFAVMAFFVTMASWEYAHIFRTEGYAPARWIVSAGTLAILAARAFFPEWAIPIFSILILAAMAYHLIDYERGRDTSAVDFAITLGGLAYLGWIGSYLMDLRYLAHGEWWFMLALPSVMMADTFAYFVGMRIGKHKMTPRLSPKKSWEGLIGGVIGGTLYGALAAWAMSTYGALDISILRGGILGLTLSILTPLGDLGESMIKRQAHLKDSSELFPGHGGAFDRIDSWLWAGAIGYYVIIWFLQ
jgi:phosphatidate cytidylyltransferase